MKERLRCSYMRETGEESQEETQERTQEKSQERTQQRTQEEAHPRTQGQTYGRTHAQTEEGFRYGSDIGAGDGILEGTYESSREDIREHIREETRPNTQAGIRAETRAEARKETQQEAARDETGASIRVESQGGAQGEDREKAQRRIQESNERQTRVETQKACSVECVRLASDGAGVGYVRGLVTFVPGLLRGETGLVHIEERKKRFQRGKLVKLIQPAAVRQDPPCPVFRVCGGCQLQHMNYAETLLWKNLWVQDALERVGKVRVRVEPVLGMDFPWRYRNKVTLHRGKAYVPGGVNERCEIAQQGRGPQGNGPLAVLGYYQNRSHVTVPFHDCLLLSERMNAWIHTVSGVIGGFPGIEDIILRESRAGDGLLLIKNSISGRDSDFAVTRTFIPEVGSAWAVRAADTPLLLWGQEMMEVSFLGVDFKVSPLAFLQVNYSMAEKLYSLVRQFADLRGKECVWDLYSGVGTLSLIVAGGAHEVYGIEENPFAVEDARRNADLNGFGHVHFLGGKVEKNLPRLPRKPDVVIMDPPRAGVTADVIDHILRCRPGKIIYVSCDPGTLARDLSRLVRGGYQVSLVQPVDMFPWTRHTEVVVLLQRER